MKYICDKCGNETMLKYLCALCRDGMTPLGTYNDGNYLYLKHKKCSHCKKSLAPDQYKVEEIQISRSFCKICINFNKHKKYYKESPLLEGGASS